MDKPLRILIVEESIPKTTLLEMELEEGGYRPVTERVDSPEAMDAELDKQQWDLVIADYSIDGFNALDALALLHRKGLDLPFIVVSDPIGEGIAAAALQAGADDIVMRGNLVRLCPAVERVLREETGRRERKQTEEALEDTRRYLVSLIESSTDAIISTNKEGLVVLYNKGAEALLGWRREEVVGQRVTMLYENEEQARGVKGQILKRGGMVSAHETTLLAKDGKAIPVLISASLLYDEKGEKAGTVGFTKDLRERKRTEEELRAAHEELKQAYDDLERAKVVALTSEKLAALGRLTVGVSREILNPLKNLTMQIQGMIEDPATQPKNFRILQGLEEQAEHIAKISQDLLHFAQLRPPERRSLDLNEIIQRAISLLDHELKKHYIAVELKVAEVMPLISADHAQTQQVVLNVLANACDAMKEGGRLTLSTEVVEKKGRGILELRVEDTGRGIPKEHLDKLFDPFFTTKTEGPSKGLGLSICHGIVESHGGSIKAESEVGRGTTVIIQLPLEHNKESDPA